MIDNIIKYGILILYILAMVAIAFFTRKRASTVGDTLLAGRNVGGWMTAFAYGTTYFSAVIFIGYAGEQGYTFGFSSLWIGIGNAVIGSLLAWQILARRTRRVTHLLKTRTMPEFFETRYESKHLKLLTALIVVVFLLPYSASVYTGLGYLFKSVFGIDFIWVVVVMAAVTATYLFFGGYFATALSDFIQGIIMLIGVVVMVAFVFNYDKVGGLIEGIGKITDIREQIGVPKVNIWQLVCLVVLTSLGSWGLPQIVHKFHTVKDEGAIKKATWVSTGFALIIGVGAYLVGCATVLVFENVAGMPSDTRIPMLLAKTLPAGLLGLITILVLSASMSTLSGLTLSISSSAAVDIYKGSIKKDAPDKRVNLIMKVISVIVIVISAGIALLNYYTGITTIVNLMSLSWGALSGCFVGPYVYGLFLKKSSKKAAYASIIGTLALTVIFYILYLSVPALKPILFPPAIGVITIAFSFIIVPIVSAFTKPPRKELVDLVVQKPGKILSIAKEAEIELAEKMHLEQINVVSAESVAATEKTQS